MTILPNSDLVSLVLEDSGMSSRQIAVCLEVSPRETIASALDWPGWCRAGRDEGAALKALASYAERYAPVARQAGVSFPSTVAFDVLERMPGGSPTAFAAPECRRPFPQMIAGVERATVTAAAARRLVGLVTGAWATFDEIAAASPAELRKGPRGGGRDVLAFASFPRKHWRQIWSNNPQERLNKGSPPGAPTCSASSPTAPPWSD
jgi:Transposase, Mutator family